MGKIIKKSMVKSTPVVLDVAGKGGKPAESGPVDIGESCAISAFIQTSMDEWKGTLSRRMDSLRKDTGREREQAYREGYEKGLAEGREIERKDRIAAIDALLREAKQKSTKSLESTEKKIIELASLIAEKIIHRTVQSDSTLVEEIVQEAMSHLVASETVVLKVSADDYTAINDKYSRWMNMAGNARDFRIEIDKRLERGDCLVENEGGIIDATVHDRINLLVDELLKS